MHGFVFVLFWPLSFNSHWDFWVRRQRCHLQPMIAGVFLCNHVFFLFFFWSAQAYFLSMQQFTQVLVALFTFTVIKRGLSTFKSTAVRIHFSLILRLRRVHCVVGKSFVALPLSTCGSSLNHWRFQHQSKRYIICDLLMTRYRRTALISRGQK